MGAIHLVLIFHISILPRLRRISFLKDISYFYEGPPEPAGVFWARHTKTQCISAKAPLWTDFSLVLLCVKPTPFWLQIVVAAKPMISLNPIFPQSICCKYISFQPPLFAELQFKPLMENQNGKFPSLTIKVVETKKSSAFDDIFLKKYLFFLLQIIITIILSLNDDHQNHLNDTYQIILNKMVIFQIIMIIHT